jgi:hypothetical protein
MSIKSITTAALTATTLMMSLASPIWAQGGNDPIEGIDIIIKKDPGSQPIKPFGFDAAEMKQINALKGDDRPTYALKVIAEEIGAGDEFVAAGMKAFEDIWCGPCKMADELAVKIRADDAIYSLTVRFKAGAELSEKVN